MFSAASASATKLLAAEVFGFVACEWRRDKARPKLSPPEGDEDSEPARDSGGGIDEGMAEDELLPLLLLW